MHKPSLKTIYLGIGRHESIEKEPSLMKVERGEKIAYCLKIVEQSEVREDATYVLKIVAPPQIEKGLLYDPNGTICCCLNEEILFTPNGDMLQKTLILKGEVGESMQDTFEIAIEVWKQPGCQSDRREKVASSRLTYQYIRAQIAMSLWEERQKQEAGEQIFYKLYAVNTGNIALKQVEICPKELPNLQLTLESCTLEDKLITEDSLEKQIILETVKPGQEIQVVWQVRKMQIYKDTRTSYDIALYYQYDKNGMKKGEARSNGIMIDSQQDGQCRMAMPEEIIEIVHQGEIERKGGEKSIHLTVELQNMCCHCLTDLWLVYNLDYKLLFVPDSLKVNYGEVAGGLSKLKLPVLGAKGSSQDYLKIDFVAKVKSAYQSACRIGILCGVRIIDKEAPCNQVIIGQQCLKMIVV